MNVLDVEEGMPPDSHLYQEGAFTLTRRDVNIKIDKPPQKESLNTLQACLFPSLLRVSTDGSARCNQRQRRGAETNAHSGKGITMLIPGRKRNPTSMRSEGGRKATTIIIGVSQA